MAHPRLVQAKDELLSAIEASAPGSLILVIGPTGVGKSTLRRRVESALIEKMAAETEIDAGRIPFISIVQRILSRVPRRMRWHTYREVVGHPA
jgi:Cdc6-like AAA superfamily ATPase